MKTTKELINELNRCPPNLKWYVSLDESGAYGSGMLLSEYTGDISNAQLVIELPIDNQALDEELKQEG